MMTVQIQNIGQDATGHTYRVEIYVNGKRIDQLIVTGHDRAQGWAALLIQIGEAKQKRDAAEGGAR